MNYYFGGIKKLNDKEEITKWKSFFLIHKLPKLERSIKMTHLKRR
jgi:hypothetical protein